jgi:hypothetical protein
MSRDKGSATAELAVALPAIVILLVTGILAIAAVTAKLGCVATAHEAAIAAARGEPLSNREGVSVETAADIVRITVARGAITCNAIAAREPGQP